MSIRISETHQDWLKWPHKRSGHIKDFILEGHLLFERLFYSYGLPDNVG